MKNETNFIFYVVYHSHDYELVKKIGHDLLEWDINLSFEHNHETRDFKQEQSNLGITQADGILFLITENSMSPAFVDNMAKVFAMVSKGSKLIIPVLYRNLPLPRFIQHFSPISWNDNYGEVINDIILAVNNFKTQRSDSSNITLPKPDHHNYWLLKLNPDTWAIEHFQINDTTFVNTHYFGKKRPEYETFHHVRKGDYVLGFAAGDYQCIVCQMEVTKPVGPDTAQGEGFEMVISKLTMPRIPITNFGQVIPDIVTRLNQNNKPPELFFSLSQRTYDQISDAGNLVEPYENLFQPFYLTEGDHENTIDQLDFQNDINSFASVITLQKMNPPLAIGLFGNWGAGKSFFMEKLYDCIRKISDDKEEGAIQNVVQVKFNSWHYSDTNLWASLITQIFESLHDHAIKKEYGLEAIKTIYKDLNITNQQLEDTQTKIKANDAQASVLQQEKTNVEQIINDKKEALKIWSARDFVQVVLSDPFIQHDFKNLKSQFETEKLIDNVSEVDKKLSQVATVWGRLSESFAILKKTHKANWNWIWILAILFAVCGWAVLGPLNKYVKEFISGGLIATGLCLTWLTNLIAKLSPHFNKINQFYQRLKSLKQTIDTEREKVKLKENTEVSRLNNEINELASTKAALEARETLITEQKIKLENQIKEIGSGKLLSNFLAERSADDTYIKQLGIISWVRKDFSKLNDLFQRQRSVQANETELPAEVQIDRIVLYIDDLDRCSEDVVVKVLEAIHLLLAFELFVVVVGVDPRWLNNALSKKYKNLFGAAVKKNEKKEKPGAGSDAGSTENSSLFEGVATSYDYLEKIFQIPFALKPINKTGREKLIKYLIRDEMAPDKQAIPDAQHTPLPADGNGKGAPAGSLDLSPGKKDNTNTGGDSVIEKKVKQRLTFTPAELVYMQQISSLFGQTPRTINRYVNIYRIIKAHKNLKVTGDFSKDEFMPVMFVLAIIVGYSVYAEKFIRQISAAADTDPFKNFIHESVLDDELKKLIKPLTVDIETFPMENFKRNVELISRFSFRTLLKQH